MRKLNTKDLKDPPRHNLPKARSQKEESIFMTKQTLWAQAYANFMTTNCNQKGVQKGDTMTQSERNGQIELKNRAKKGEIVISETDKSTEITISSWES